MCIYLTFSNRKSVEEDRAIYVITIVSFLVVVKIPTFFLFILRLLEGPGGIFAFSWYWMDGWFGLMK